MKLQIAALGVALVLTGAAPPALAQAPPSREQVQLGIAFCDQMLAVMDINAMMAKSMTASFAGPDGDFVKIEPKWRDYFLDAMNEEIKADHAAIVATMGRAFAKSFTAEELQVGIVVFRDPAMAGVMKALAAGQPAPADVKLQPATAQAMASPAGRSFAAKFAQIDAVMNGAKSDLVHVLIPGFFQRFGEKAGALERQRRQAEGIPAAGG
ncbi:MAG: hypothetical protein ACXU82_02640 [Caulobacteraceae bacterium]